MIIRMTKANKVVVIYMRMAKAYQVVVLFRTTKANQVVVMFR